jgi:hypothetical protein
VLSVGQGVWRVEVDHRRRRLDRLHRLWRPLGERPVARASIPSSGMNFSTGRYSTASPRLRSLLRAGAAIAIPSARIHPLAIARKHLRPCSGRLRHPEPLRRQPKQ